MRKQLGGGLPSLVVDQFTALCENEQLRPSEAVEEFMRRAIGVGDVKEALDMVAPGSEKAPLARELKARAIMARIQGEIKDGIIAEAYSDYRELLQILPALKNPSLIEEIRELSKQVNSALKG